MLAPSPQFWLDDVVRHVAEAVRRVQRHAEPEELLEVRAADVDAEGLLLLR